MPKASVKNNFIAGCVFCAAIIVDVVTKKIVAVYFADKLSVGNFLVFGNFINDKGLFGFVSLAPVVVISVIIFIFILYLFFQKNTAEEKISLSLVLGGGVSNFYERLIFGRVTDIMSIGNLGIMNVADVAIFVGTIWYAYALIKKYN